MPKQGVWLGGQLGGGVAYRGIGYQRKKGANGYHVNWVNLDKGFLKQIND